MGSSSKRRRSGLSRRHFALLALLPHSIAAQQVALSDFAPRLVSLSQSCQQVYTSAIPGCSFSDFTDNNPTCSSSCLNGLVRINGLIASQCAQDDVPELSIIGLFKLGRAIQTLCNVAVVTTTPGVPNTGGGGGGALPPNTVSSRFPSTMTMSASTTQNPSPVLSQTQLPSSQSARPTSNGMIGQSPIPPPPSSLPRSTDPTLALPEPSSTSSSTTGSLSPAALESLRSGNVGSGGGSPFDNIDNSEASRLRAVGGLLTSILAASMFVTLLRVR